jgi:ribosomal protein S6
MQYELNYLVGESKEANLEEIKKNITEMVSQEGAVFVEPQILEKRKMAYKVQKDIRGTYIAQRFNLPEKDAEEGYNPDVISNINKKMNLDQSILRFIIVKAEDLPELKAQEIVEKGRREKPKNAFRRDTTVRPEKPKVETPKPKEETQAQKEDIDKKLDEILNI